MNQSNYIKVFMIFTSIALLTSIILNFTLASKLSDLDNQVQSISNSQFDIMNTVSSQTSSVQNILHDMKEEQSWLSRINVEFNDIESSEDQAVATFEWQVKELEDDSEVLFHYAFGESEEYTSVPAEELQQGLYQVTIPFDIEQKPLWEVYVRYPETSTDEAEISKKLLEEKMIRDQDSHELKYYVTVSYGELVKSGEIQRDNFSHFWIEHYGVLQGDVEMDNDKLFLHLDNHNTRYPSVYAEEAFLLKYKDNEIIEEVALISEENSHMEERFFYLEEAESYEKDMRLVLKVVYSNGKTFEKEIY